MISNWSSGRNNKPAHFIFQRTRKENYSPGEKFPQAECHWLQILNVFPHTDLWISDVWYWTNYLYFKTALRKVALYAKEAYKYHLEINLKCCGTSKSIEIHRFYNLLKNGNISTCYCKCCELGAFVLNDDKHNLSFWKKQDEILRPMRIIIAAFKNLNNVLELLHSTLQKKWDFLQDNLLKIHKKVWNIWKSTK